MSYDPDKARAVQLGFKKQTEGLSSEEEKELERLKVKASIKERTQEVKPIL